MDYLNTLRLIKDQSKKVGISLKPKSKINLIQDYLKEVDTPIYGTFIDGSNIKDFKQLPEDVHLILGNESNGISEEVTCLVTNRVAVKNIGLKTESLNVAMAAAIFLHEFCA